MAKDGESDNHHHHQDHVDEMPNDDNCHGETSNSRPLVDNDSRSITAMNIAATNSSASATNDADSSHQIHPDATNCMRNTHSCDIDAVSDRAECFAASPLSFHSGDIDIRYSTGNNKDPYLPRILTPPRQSEQSAKEQLIERERQARMERERARLKRQFTLSREKEEEEKAIMNSVELKPRGDLKNDDEDEDSKSLACTAGEEESDEEHDIKGVNTESAGYKTDSVNDDKSVTKLGFTMERFLQNNSMGVENMEVHPDLQAVSVPLPLPAAAASEHEEEEVGSTVSIEVRMCHSDVSVSCRTDRDEITSESNVDLNVEEGMISHHIPRLAQLAEAQILVDMAEIDYASVGNMPPRSVRDEQQLPDLSGMSNASFDLTHTTVQESDTSICAPSVRTRTSSVGNAIVSPGESNIMGQLPVDNVTSNASYNSIESNPSEILNGGNALDDNGKLDAIMLEGCDEQLSSSPCAPLVSTTPFDEYSFNQEDTTTKEEHLPHRSEDLGKGTLHPERCNAEDCGDTQLDDSTVHIYKYPNRIVRPGMIKVGDDTKLSKGHRRAQTTPNIPSFIDDFDYCKYNNHEPTSNQSQIFGGAGTCFDDISGKTTSKWNLISHPSYGAIDPEEGAQFLNPSLQNEEEDDPNGVFALDSMIESVFSSLRSMSTADFQAEINDCDRYSSSHIMKRGELRIYVALSLAGISFSKLTLFQHSPHV